jgi:hypothetical protein
MVNGKMVYAEFTGTSEVSFRDSYDTKEPIFNAWQSFIDD